MNKKDNLIKALKVAISSLENDTINYNWDEQCSCNCGVVAQAVLGKTEIDINNGFAYMYKKLKKHELSCTWKNGVKNFCSITGNTDVQIFKDLFSAGMSAEDIVHLEYLENSSILKRAKIRTRFLGVFAVEYYNKKKNLIKYLKAWVQILEEKSIPTVNKNLTKNQLNESLLRAVAGEEFEEAAKIRDLISTY